MSKNMQAPRVMISAAGSGMGKTTITSLILKLLKDMELDVHAYKCGPDYIDPMYHESVLGLSSKNLDPFFCDEELMKASFAGDEGEVNIIEGCMGLFDGMGVTDECSPYTVASHLECPVILVLDAYGKAYSLLPEIAGFLAYDTKHLIKGIILNRISAGYYEKISPVIEEELGISVLGFLPKLSEELFASRHLGLKSAEENNARDKIAKLAIDYATNIDIKRILEIAGQAKKLVIEKQITDYVNQIWAKKTIAVAKDEAFNFYYKDNLTALRLSGAELVFFSPIHDDRLPLDVDALYIGGGYPELYVSKLSQNTSMIQSIRDFVDRDGYVFAECGGFMYLNKAIEGVSQVGIFEGDAKGRGSLVRFGYISAVVNGLEVRGHEFHHYDVEEPGEEMLVTKASTGLEYHAGCRKNNCLAGFPHLYFLSEPKIIKTIFG